HLVDIEADEQIARQQRHQALLFSPRVADPALRAWQKHVIALGFQPLLRPEFALDVGVDDVPALARLEAHRQHGRARRRGRGGGERFLRDVHRRELVTILVTSQAPLTPDWASSTVSTLVTSGPKAMRKKSKPAKKPALHGPLAAAMKESGISMAEL